jgi:hypothetical protein
MMNKPIIIGKLNYSIIKIGLWDTIRMLVGSTESGLALREDSVVN